MNKVANQIKSLFTDREWDADVTKVFGVALVIAGCIGWWKGKTEFQWIIGFGAGLISTGKFSKEG